MRDQHCLPRWSKKWLINTFTVNADEAPQLLKAWAADAAWMRQQPGFISTQLHRVIAGSCVFLNYAVWESTGHFKQAFIPLPSFGRTSRTIRPAQESRHISGIAAQKNHLWSSPVVFPFYKALGVLRQSSAVGGYFSILWSRRSPLHWWIVMQSSAVLCGGTEAGSVPHACERLKSLCKRRWKTT